MIKTSSLKAGRSIIDKSTGFAALKELLHKLIIIIEI